MNADDSLIIERVFAKRISTNEWSIFLESEDGQSFNQRLKLVRETLNSAGKASQGPPARPVKEVIDLYGSRILTSPDVGPWLRRVLLQNLPLTRWNRLKALYPRYSGKMAPVLHGKMVQHGAGSEVMASYWRLGSRWAFEFCNNVGLPLCLCERDEHDTPVDTEILPAEAVKPLHDFQNQVYEKLIELLELHTGSAMLSLPTGAGKTRVAVEAICDHLALRNGDRHNVVLWIAQSEELQLQAWECFRQVWQVPPDRSDGARIKRVGPLRLISAWGGRRIDDIELDSEKTVIIAGIQQLHSWAKRYPDSFAEIFPTQRRAAVIIDEAHKLIAKEHSNVLGTLGLRLKTRWQYPQHACVVVGLTATPWHSKDASDVSLRSYFQKSLLTPVALGNKPIQELQRREILSKVIHKKLKITNSPGMTDKQRRDLEKFHDLPPDYLATLGRDPGRNATIIRKLCTIKQKAKVLVFACSIDHAELLTLLLNRALGTCAAIVTGKTPGGQRASTIERFRNGDLRFLVNVGVLTTGFDAPKVDVVCLTRPTCSAILYEQMVGRGLRGPKNGGTKNCLVIDVQDVGLPVEVQSYGRVLALWGGSTQ